LIGRWLGGALGILVLVSSTDTVRADAQESARRFYAEGARLYEQHDYLRAIRAFERAYEISGSPALLFNLGQANRLLGPERCAKALSYYELYLRLDKDAPNRGESERRVVEMRTCITRPGDTGIAEATEPDASAAPAVAASTSAPARAPEAVDASASLPLPSAVAPAAPREREQRSVAPAAYVLGAVGVAGIAVFATFALLGKSEQRHLESTCSPRCDPADVDALRTKFLIADLALVAGVVSLGATTYLVVSSEPRRSASIGIAGSF
jgi:tetratricopeptide (TPR) repeat protein